MHDRHTPYIGVSGFMSADEVHAALDAFPACGRLLMVGVLVSSKTLGGERNKYPRRYPRIEDVAGIFPDDPRALRLVHYSADLPPDREVLTRLYEVAGPRCDGFQFNVEWPYRDDLLALHERAERDGRRLRVVLQARPGNVPAQGYFYDVVTDLLFDGSGGRGVPLDRAFVDEGLRRARHQWHAPKLGPVGLGVAGGLSAQTIAGVADLLRAGVSCDAEGALRDAADGGGNIDLDKVRSYLGAAADALTL